MICRTICDEIAYGLIQMRTIPCIRETKTIQQLRHPISIPVYENDDSSLHFCHALFEYITQGSVGVLPTTFLSNHVHMKLPGFDIIAETMNPNNEIFAKVSLHSRSSKKLSERLLSMDFTCVWEGYLFQKLWNKQSANWNQGSKPGTNS